MNNVPNSDSEQCTESKLGWVHQVHTLTQAARTAPRPCAQRRVAGLAWPCRRPGLAVSQAWPGRVVAPSRPCRRHRRSCHRPSLGRITAVPRAPLCALCRAYRSSVRRIAALLRAASRYNPATKLPPVTIQFIISRHSPPARPRAHALPTVSWPPLAVSWAWLAVSWPAFVCPCAFAARPGQPPRPLCHDTNLCIVTQCMLKMGSSPAAACNVSFFFHTIFFLIPTTGKPPKKYYYFFFHFLVNQINL